jgi:hypothetical protein
MNKKQTFFWTILIVVIASSTAYSFKYLFNRLRNVETKLDKILTTPQITDNDGGKNNLQTQETYSVDSCGESCKKIVSDIVSKAIASVSSTTKIIEKKTTTKSFGTVYVPMGTSYTTTATDWYTIDDTGVYINLENDYGASAKVSWEALLKVAHGNGQAYARLWDDTNKIAVMGSELTSINNSEYQFVSSGNIPFWKGRNLYKVQVKSLNSFEVFITGGKIRITY